MLRNLLWTSERCVPALVSATLKTFGNFERFSARVGLPSNAKTDAADPIFDYRKSELVVVNLQKTPRYEDRAAWEQEVCQELPEFIHDSQATLVLFPSVAIALFVLAFNLLGDQLRDELDPRAKTTKRRTTRKGSSDDK